MKTLLKAERILLPNGEIENAGILIEDQTIEHIFREIPNEVSFEVRDYGKNIISPGFIDVHVHGANGFDVSDGSFESLNGMSKFLASTGTAAFLATTLTISTENILKAIDAFLAAKEQGVDGSQLLGMHLEGPFINPQKKGAQNEDYVRRPDPEELQLYINRLGKDFKLITLAPELDDDFATIHRAKKAGAVVSAGHSCASYEVALHAFDAGITHATHVFNAMEPLHHRTPGLVAAALSDSRISAEVIADTVHVHPGVIKVILAAKGEQKVTLVTDCMRAANLADGEYDLGGLTITVTNGIARTSDGGLAGSTLRMIDAVKNLVEFCQVPLYKAVNMASLNPAQELGVADQTGSIHVGNYADVTVFNESFEILSTYVKGKNVYEASLQTTSS